MIPKIIRICIFLIAFGAFAAVPKAAISASASQALHALTPSMTGIYLMAILDSSGSRKEVLALVYNGRVREIHTRKMTNHAYLGRNVQSRPAQAVSLSSGTFNQLIGIAGGVNRNVNNLTPAILQNFVMTANLDGSGGGSNWPPTVPRRFPDPCPFGYEINPANKGECRLKAEMPRDLVDQMLAWLKDSLSVTSAHAYFLFEFRTKYLSSWETWGFTYEDAPGGPTGPGWRFTGFGFNIVSFDGPSG